MAALRWQYLIADERERMSELGEAGWELVSVAVVNGQEHFYYKKPYPSIREEITQAQRDRAIGIQEGEIR